MPGQRRTELDAARGLMLVWMALTHLPTAASIVSSEPIGYATAAQGFIFLSGLFCGLIYFRLAMRRGYRAMTARLWKRAVRLYGYVVLLLAMAFLVVAPIAAGGGMPGLHNLLDFFYTAGPQRAVPDALALIYQPPLLDILPMYVVLLAVTPLLLSFALRRGWWPIIALSAALWVSAQLGAGRALYEALAGSIGLDLPVTETGAFSLLAWQLVWVGGLWMGSLKVTDAGGLKAPRWALAPAIAIAVVCLVWRHLAGQVPYPHATGNELNALFDKWHLAPLRLVNFLALLVLVLHFGPRLARRVPLAFLARLGAASLPVFCAHLVICLLALAFLGDRYDHRSWVADVVLLVGAFAALYAVAEFVQLAFRSVGDPRARYDALNARSAKSPISIARSP